MASDEDREIGAVMTTEVATQIFPKDGERVDDGMVGAPACGRSYGMHGCEINDRVKPESRL